MWKPCPNSRRTRPHLCFLCVYLCFWVQTHKYVPQRLFTTKFPSRSLPKWIDNKWTFSDLLSFRPVCPTLLREAAETLKVGKTSHTDMIVAEMVLALDDQPLQILADIFVRKLLNRESEEDRLLWKRFEVKLIQKLAGSTKLTDFRSISIIPILFKLYFQVVHLLTEGVIGNPLTEQFAYKAGHQSMEVVFILKRAARITPGLKRHMACWQAQVKRKKI